MKGVVVAVALVVLGPVGAPSVRAEGAKQVKVVFESRQSGAQSRDAVQGSGGVIVTERGGAHPSGRVGVESTQRTVTRTTGLFTIVLDGGESTLLVASQVPYPQVVYYRDYLTRAGYVATGVAFTDVGAALNVRATVMPGNQVRLRLTPRISWFTRQQTGIAEVNEAATELVVPNGRPVAFGGAAVQVHELTRRILGAAASQSSTETLMTVTATVVD
jgi:hypothetical protein